MAIRKRSETIHLRTTPFVKSTLDVLAALNDKTATSVIESLLYEAMSRTVVAAPKFVKPEKVSKGKVSLIDLMEGIYTDNELLFKLRLFLLVPSTISGDDRLACEAISNDLKLEDSVFSGEDKIFDEKCSEFISDIEFPGVDTDRLAVNVNVLKKYVEFKKKNPEVDMNYRTYLEVIFLKSR